MECSRAVCHHAVHAAVVCRGGVRDWRDLLQPALRGRVGFIDSPRSGTGWAVGLLKACHFGSIGKGSGFIDSPCAGQSGWACLQATSPALNLSRATTATAQHSCSCSQAPLQGRDRRCPEDVGAELQLFGCRPAALRADRRGPAPASAALCEAGASEGHGRAAPRRAEQGGAGLGGSGQGTRCSDAAHRRTLRSDSPSCPLPSVNDVTLPCLKSAGAGVQQLQPRAGVGCGRSGCRGGLVRCGPLASGH